MTAIEFFSHMVERSKQNLAQHVGEEAASRGRLLVCRHIANMLMEEGVKEVCGYEWRAANDFMDDCDGVFTGAHVFEVIIEFRHRSMIDNHSLNRGV
jgi:DNA relaxase NicK